MQVTPIQLSDNAKNEIKNIFATKNIPANYSLRVGVKGSGCAGVSYLFGFDQKRETDEEFIIDEISVIVAKKDFIYLLGLEIDYTNTVEETGFVFKKD